MTLGQQQFHHRAIVASWPAWSCRTHLADMVSIGTLVAFIVVRSVRGSQGPRADLPRGSRCLATR